MDRPSYVVSAEQVHHNNKNRNFIRILLFLIGIIILLASIFLLTIIYRTLKSGTQKKSLTILDSNFTDIISNRSERTCLYGHTECEYGATCTEQNLCQCLFNCTDDDNRIQEETTGKLYSNKCRFDQSKCHSFYEKKDLTCSSINCSHGAKCRINDYGLPQCYCPNNCNEYIRTISSNGSVCASDNHTYQTICQLNKKACEKQLNLSFIHLGKCQHCQDSTCILNNEKCDPYINCSIDFQPICANNLHNYSNECQMNKYSCQSNINLTKLHDGVCYLHEQQQLFQACKTLICLNGKTCMIENGNEVCQCLFNCSAEKNQICASNGILYRNICEMERDRCIRGDNFIPVDNSYCCDGIHCPYGQCKECSLKYSDQELICGDNGITYPSKCYLEQDACKRKIDIKANHMGQCNNCENVICPFHGQCQSQQGNYTCICPTKQTCSYIRNNNSNGICGSNEELFYSQCEMDIRSCELKTHIYTIAPLYCIKEKQEIKFNHECEYDEPLIDLKSNYPIQCDTIERCPLNSYCNKQTNRCCVKVITAVLPYKMCLENRNCGKNMICLKGLCQCATDDLIPVIRKRECVSLLHSYLLINSTCHSSPFGCCRDNLTLSPTFDRQGCPEYCNCHSTGSLRLSCDPKTNSCHCRPAVSGLTCSYCENEYWAFSRILTHNNTGCTPCGCHPYGSVRKDCLQDTGQCSCHTYTTGRQCEKCIDTSLTLTEHGCVNLNKNRRRRQRTCRDLSCLFDGICEIINGQPRCTCDQIVCTHEEKEFMNICASDGRTYKSICDIKRQQCLKQYEIVLMYPGVCNGIDEDLQLEDDYIGDYGLQTVSIDSKRCIVDMDCGENMVCLSEFCECAKQKYKRISGPRCIMPELDLLESFNNTSIINPVRHISNSICIQGNLCQNYATCQDQPDGNYKCLCTFGWKGRYCNEKITITIPRFHRQSYLELSSSIFIKYIDLTFTSERRNGLILYSYNKLTEFEFIISIRNKIIQIIIRFDQLNTTIELLDIIELNILIRLQIHILYNEIQIKINNENILSRLLPFEISLNNSLYLGGVPQLLNFLYEKFNVDDGFQGCIHKLFINERQIMFNHSQFISQNIDECSTNFCRSKSCSNEISSSLIDQCLIKPCENNQECINIYPNNYLCICLNCSSNNRYIAGFHSNSYIKYLPFQSLENTGRFKIEIWFLTESSSGLLIYSEHINSKKGHIKVYIQRKMIIFNVIIGSKSISLSSRSPIELNKWHQCSIEIYGQKLTLILDRESPVISYELFSSNILWPRSFTFIGHLPNQYQLTNSFITDGFRGAIQKIIINNDHVLNDIRQNAIELFNISEYHGYPCQPNPCQLNNQCYQTELNNYTCIKQFQEKDISLELDGTINAIYLYQPLNLNRNYFQLLIKTKYSFGLIFYVGETSLSFFSSYLSLTLVDGFLEFTVKIDINSTKVSLKSKIRIDDGRWHRIEIERFRRRIIMKLDDNYRYQTVLPSKQTEFYPNPSYIYIGGYHRLCSYNEQHCRSYRGCLKNVTIDNNYINLINDEINQHRILKQCHDFY